jgi:integrase
VAEAQRLSVMTAEGYAASRNRIGRASRCWRPPGCPSLAKKAIRAHVIRHTTATHLLRTGVDINTIRARGSAMSRSTRPTYIADVDLETKARMAGGRPRRFRRLRPRRGAGATIHR